MLSKPKRKEKGKGKGKFLSKNSIRFKEKDLFIYLFFLSDEKFMKTHEFNDQSIKEKITHFADNLIHEVWT